MNRDHDRGRTMKTTRLWKPTVRPAAMLTALLLAITLAGCGGSVVTGGGSTAVTVTVGAGASTAAPAAASSRATPRPLAATIPASVTRIRFTISGSGMDNLVQEFAVPPSGGTLTVTLQVPSGPGRTILVEALDSGGSSRFRGTAVIDASGVPLAVAIGMIVDPANPALQTWTLAADTDPAFASLNRVAQGDGILLAGGTSGEILSSIDGNNWTSRTSVNLTGDIIALAFGDNTFLAMTSTPNFTAVPVRYTTRFYGAATGALDNWSLRGTVVTADVRIRDLAFGGGTFVAVGDNNAIYSLDNGATWSPGTFSGAGGLSHVSYGNGRFIALNRTGDAVLVSTDGIGWTTASIGIPLAEFPDLLGFGNGLFLATTSAGNVYTSADGTTWLPRTQFLDLSSTEISTYSVAAGGGGFMIVTSSGLFFTFDSGATWTAVDPGASLPGLSAFDGTYFNGAFLLVGIDGGSGLGGVFRSGDL